MRVPVVRQTGASDCGLAALEMVLRHHGTRYERHELRRLLGGTTGGASMETLRAAARAFGFDAEGFDAPADLLDGLPAPAILHWRRGHFVVFEGMVDGRASIVDPVRGRELVRGEELARQYSGCALVLEPGARLHPVVDAAAAARDESEWDRARALLAPWIRVERPVLLRLAATAMALGAAAAAGVWCAGRALTGLLEAGAVPTVPAAAAVAALGATTAFGVHARRLEAGLTERLGDFLARRFTRMTASAPDEYLATRTSRFLEHLAGDLDPSVNPRIPSFRCIRMLALALAAAAGALLVSGEIGVAVAASLVAVAAGAEWRTRRWSRRAARRDVVQGAREWGRAVLARPADLRAAGTLTSALERWADRRARGAAGARTPVAPPEPSPTLLGAAFLLIALPAGSAAVAGRLGQGEATAALVLGITALVALHGAAGEFQRFRTWAATLAALADVALEVPAPAPPPDPAWSPAETTLRCRGLRYASAGRERLSATTLEVGPGEAVAITGDAGARSAFARIVLGLVHPSEGEVTIGGVDPARLEEGRRRDLVAGVLSGAEPLAATLLENFRMVDPACGRAAVLDACARVGLGDWVGSVPLAELVPLSPGTLPGAVPRLLCLARLQPRLPRILVLDGTLDELDAEQARALATSLRSLPCTLVLCTGRADVLPPEFRVVRVSSPVAVARAAPLHPG